MALAWTWVEVTELGDDQDGRGDGERCQGRLLAFDSVLQVEMLHTETPC